MSDHEEEWASKDGFEAYKEFHRREHGWMQRDIDQVREATVNLAKAGTETMKVLDKMNSRMDKQEAEEAAPLRFVNRLKEWATAIVGLAVALALVWQILHAPDPKKVEKLADKLEAISK